MASSADLLSQAIQHCEAQRLSEAEQLFCQILASEPNHIRALEMLGVVAGGQDRIEEGIAFLQRAVAAGSRSGETFKNLAVLLHAVGRVVEAQAAAEKGTQLDPGFLEGHFVLGNLLFAQGQLRAAVGHYHRVIAMEPRFVPAYVNLCVIHRTWTELETAEGYARQVTQIEPANPVAHCQLAHLLRMQQKYEAAVAEYKEAIRLDPKYFEAYEGLGNLFESKGRYDDSAAIFAQLHKQEPNEPMPAVRLSDAYLKQNQAVEAAFVLEPLVAQGIVSPDIHAQLGKALQAQGKWDQAKSNYEQALKLDARHQQAWHNLGLLNSDQGFFERAAECQKKALELKSDDPDVHFHLANAYRDLGEVDLALASYDKSLYHKPDRALAHWHRGLILLTKGLYAEGWKEYEWRWLAFTEMKRPLPAPVWDGSPVPGKTVLLDVEQGFGDFFQFIRYAPMVAERAGRVLVGTTQDLKLILATAPGVSAISASGEPTVPFDYHVSVLSLPLLFGSTLETIPQKMPYLFPSKERVSHFRTRIAQATPAGAKLKVGLAWAGRPTHGNDLNRSMPLSALAPLGKLNDVCFFSLQKWKPIDKWGSSVSGLSLIDLTPELKNFHDTAAFIENLDIVLCVDTSIAHLTGALGKECWVMLPFPAEWRWLLNRTDSPWYPKSRLFRQTRGSGWGPVVQEVSAALQARLSGNQ